MPPASASQKGGCGALSSCGLAARAVELKPVDYFGRFCKLNLTVQVGYASVCKAKVHCY